MQTRTPLRARPRPLQALTGLAALCLATFASASPFFDGTTGNLFLVDPETGQVVAFDFGDWVEEFSPSGTPRLNLSSGEVALVNAVPGSSIAPTPGQPALSLADVGAVAIPGAFDAERPSLLIRPADGTYDGTIAVRLEVSAAVIRAGGAVLSWQVNGAAPESAALSPADLAGAELNEDYFARIVYLVRDGDYDVTAELLVNGAPRARAAARYTLSSSDPDGFRRDTDGDGLPDIVEIELGLDPFSDDWQALDADGWSRFDKWLRSRCLDENLVPIETGDPCVDEDGLPLDSDSDGWADFDERLRRTNPADPEPLLVPEAEETVDSEAFRQRVLRYKDFPAASRLYEPERVAIDGTLPVDLSNPTAPWLDVTAASAVGRGAYALPAQLTAEEIAAARLDPTTVATRLQRAAADARLAEGRLPLMRLGAGDSMIVAAAQFVRSPDGESRRVYKGWLPRRPDVTPLLFREVEGAGSWETAAEWRRDFIGFLAGRLAVDERVDLDAAGTRVVSILEGALGEEARVSGLQPLLVFAHPGRPVTAEFIQAVEASLDDLAAADANLDAAYAAMTADVAAGGPLQAVAAWLGPWLDAPPPGTRSDVHIAGQFQRSFDIGCFLTDEEQALLQTDAEAWDAFLARCGEPLDLAGLQARLDEDAQRVYLARLFLLPGAAVALASDGTLATATADSDLDGLDNGIELSVPLDRIGLPWLADTDGDGVLDGDDPCPVDPLDFCTGAPTRPGVRLDPDFSVFEPASGVGYALIGIELEREYDEPVTIFFETFIDAGDSATPGSDFVAVQGSVTIAAGQRVALLRIEISADRELDPDESFSVRITSIDGGVLSGAGTVRIVINDTPPEDGCAPAGCFVGGEVLGLAAGSVLQLLLNDGLEEINLAGPLPFFFGTPLPDGSAFTVTIGSQPTSPPQDCLVQNGSGVLAGADFPDVLVLCFPAANLQATATDAQVTLNWNAVDFPAASFAVCRTEQEPLAGFANCLSYTGGQLFENVSQPLVQAGLVNGRRYWYLLEVRHVEGVRTYSAPASATPEAPPEPGVSRLNDSGQFLCYDEATGSMAACSEAVTGDAAAVPRQDGRFGRDAQALAGQLDKRGAGSGGFDFTPLDAAGNPIPLVGGAPESAPSCIRDNVTGLTWEVKTAANRDTRLSRAGGFNYANTVSAAGLCGFSDWRLPLRRELLSIVDASRRTPAIDTRFFPNTVGAEYWSNDVYRPNSANAWYVDFALGSAFYNTNGTSYRVRVVRGERLPTADPVDNGDGTVTDLATGLTWDKCPLGQAWDAGANTCSTFADGERRFWPDVMRLVGDANAASHRGHSDWRLPSRVELESIVDLVAQAPGTSVAAIDNTVFPNTAQDSYWTSTVSSRAPEPEIGSTALEAARVSFGDGRVGIDNLTSVYRIRMVRGGDVFDALETPAVQGGRLNDTGRTSCFDGVATIQCTAANFGNDAPWPRQDARFGRDARAVAGTLQKVGSGPAGFDFTPLDADGQEVAVVDGSPVSVPVCVRDNVTGLTWEVKTPANATTRYTRNNAGAYGNNVNTSGGLCGFTDWRLPRRRDLLSIVDSERDRPALDTRFFPNTPASLTAVYWAFERDLSAFSPLRYWTVNFAFGDSSGYEGTTTQLVRLVRGEALPEADFVDNADGTVTDLSTGLMWDKCDWGQAWDAVSNRCASPDTSLQPQWAEGMRVSTEANAAEHRGRSDWRLPSSKEIESMMSLARTFPAIQSEVSPSGVFYNAATAGVYWTSSVRFVSGSTVTVWVAGFNFGSVRSETLGIFGGNRVRLVRGGDDFDGLE